MQLVQMNPVPHNDALLKLPKQFFFFLQPQPSPILWGNMAIKFYVPFLSNIFDENFGVWLLCFKHALQVREKLSAAEYIDFVGYMKALKTKAMKIGEVLQCISRLFSAPERLPLLKRYLVKV